VAVDDSSDATNGGSVEIDVTANDIAADKEDTLTIDSVTQGTNGTVSVTTGGGTYTHDGSATLPIPLPRRSPSRIRLVHTRNFRSSHPEVCFVSHRNYRGFRLVSMACVTGEDW
jgi:hypothetical protein